jgi:hypothetical protein
MGFSLAQIRSYPASSPVTVKHLAGLPLITYGQMRDVHSVEHQLGRPSFRRCPPGAIRHGP